MKSHDQDNLWRDVFSDDKLEQLRSETLASGTSAIRSRRRRPLIISAAAATAMVAVSLVTGLRHSSTQPQETAPIPAETAPHSSLVTYIDDRQLLALFPGKAAALIGKPGEQQFILSDSDK